MTIISTLYPTLSSRVPLPLYYTPLVIILSILPFLTTPKSKILILSAFPLLLYICVSWPCFTTGDPADDYYNNSHFIALPLWYIDFVVLTPWEGGDAPRFVGSERQGNDGGVRWIDLDTFTKRLKWGFRLMFPPAQRGIGWNWQVKGVPAHPDVSLAKGHFVRKQFLSAIFYYALCVVSLTVLGFCHGMWRATLHSDRYVLNAVSTALLGWMGAIWVWSRLCCAYNSAAGVGVAVGLTEIWEWPPLMGPLRGAWNVRQMWSVTYHQVCRRLLSQPTKRIVNLFQFRKNSLVSRYSQLFLTFGISCLIHQAQMFNVTRRDMGERAFFLSQPLAICLEDLVCWTWKRTVFSEKSRRFEVLVGYLWMVAWFSFSLRFYVHGLVQAKVLKDWALGHSPLVVGAEIGERLTMLLNG